MNEEGGGLQAGELSDLIGEIYDCVIDPTHWQATHDRLRDLLGCTSCVLIMADLRNATTRMQNLAGLDPYWSGRFPEYSTDLAVLMSSVWDPLLTRALDEPFVGHRALSEDALQSDRYWQEWVAPQGIVDIISLRVMHCPDCFAELSLARHKDVGLITEREVRLLRLLAPHLRRAVLISDLIDMRRIEVEALSYTLDMVPAGVVLVDEEAEILHANRAASRMIDTVAPIRSARGKLSVADSKTAACLRQVVAAARNAAEIGGAGIGMALNGHAGPPATAHVLPLAEGALRSRLMPKGVAAVFVASESARPAMDLQPVADAFGLSRAETRVLERLMLGDSLPDAAAALCISHNTAKTHLSHLFSKTGTQRQASLVALVNRLLPPVAP